MADILTLVFRTFEAAADGRRERTVEHPSPAASSSLLIGEHGLSRSVLLLAAVTAASEAALRVVFFTQTQIQSLPVSLHKCVPSLSPESLKKIKFCYPRTLEELLLQVASLHKSPPPSLVIVDGLEGYLCRPAGTGGGGAHLGDQSCAAHLSALLCDTCSFLTQHPLSPAPCRLLASFQSQPDAGKASSSSDPVLDVLDRYFPVRCTLDRDRDRGHGPQDLWHIYFSGTAVTESTDRATGRATDRATGRATDRATERATGSEDKSAVAPEWQLLMSPDGSMEFKLV